MIEKINYNIECPTDIPYQWNGTNLPSLPICIFIKLYYNILCFIILKIVQIKRNIKKLQSKNIVYNNSEECETLNIYFKLHKSMITCNIDVIRLPFFAIVLLPIYSFKLKIFNLNNIIMYQIKSLNIIKKTNKRTIFYIHGGGFISGDFAGFKGFVSKLSHLTNYSVYFPQYRLAPEHSLEEMLTDCYEAYKYVSNLYEEVIIMGDSAGGHLCFLLLNKIYKTNILRPYKIILFSPLVDLNCNTNSYNNNKKIDPILDPIIIKEVIKMTPMKYIYNIKPNINYPPILIFIGKNEIIVDDSINYVKKANKLGLKIELIIEDVFHSWQFFDIPESKKTFTNLLKFLE